MVSPVMQQPCLVVLDVDSTLIENEVIELLAAHAGVEAQVAAITERAMRGELDFAESLRERVATLEGLPTRIFEEVRNQITVTTGVPDLIYAVKASGGFIGVVSGGFHEVLDPLAESLGLDFWKANRLAISDGLLTGEVLGAIVDAEVKAQTLVQWARETGIPLERTVAIGDGANDLKMMAVAGLSVAFNAKPIVREKAMQRVDDKDMRQVLPLIGLEMPSCPSRA
jgi:phosphoserine phosphatase